jgi:hypothetical protein
MTVTHAKLRALSAGWAPVLRIGSSLAVFRKLREPPRAKLDSTRPILTVDGNGKPVIYHPVTNATTHLDESREGSLEHAQGVALVMRVRQEGLFRMIRWIIEKLFLRKERASTVQKPQEIFIEDIDSFRRARAVEPQEVRSLLPLNLTEDQVQAFFEEIIGENFHQQDWGGELNDLVTSHVRVGGKRLRAVSLLKGSGTKGKLTIRKCGRNGDQIIRLTEAQADLYVIQHVDEIDERVVYDLRGKVQLKIRKGEDCQMCIIDGTDTARVLRAYRKI